MKSRFETALAVARARQALRDPRSGADRLVNVIEVLARPRTINPPSVTEARAYAFLANARVEAGVAVGGEAFWASEWIETRALPDALTEIDGVAHVREVECARVAVCAACGDPTYAVSEEYVTYFGDVVASVFTLCLRCPALTEPVRARASCWKATTESFAEFVVAARAVSYSDTFAWLVRRLGEDWRRPSDTQRVYARRREPEPRGLVFWPLELCDLPAVAGVLARTTPGPIARLGTLDEIARPACVKCGAEAFALGEDRGPDQGGLNYDVFDLDVCARCRHVSTRGVEFAVQYPRA